MHRAFFICYNRHMNQWKKIIIAAVIVLAVLAGLGVAYAMLFAAPGTNTEQQQFTIPLEATSTPVVAAQLQQAGLVKNAWAFQVAFGLHKGNIQAGGYLLSPSMNAWQAARVLSQPPALRWAVIPEGLRKEEIAAILAKALDWSSAQEQEWIATDTAQNPDYIEGVYFPDTYLIPITDTPAQVAQRLIAKFEEKFAPYAKEAIAQNIRWVTVLRLASIVQREAAGKSDMPLVAGILWNRLLKNMKLQVDSTVQYARGNTGKGWWAPISVADEKIDSPYNTYLYAGLPPHPIDNPGLDAINAVLNPAKTDCMYYLHDTAGQIHCAVTYQEHLKNIQTYLQ